MKEVIKITDKIISYKLLDNVNSELVDKEEIILEDVKLPSQSDAKMVTLKAESKKWYLTVVSYEGTEQPFALFCHTNSKEKSAQTSDAVDRLIKLARIKGIPEKHVSGVVNKTKNDNNVSKLTRTISLLLRHGVLIKNIVGTLDKMEDIYIGSFLFQLKKFMSRYILDGEKAEGSTCLDCGGTNLNYSEGCLVCLDCGGSKCG